MSTQNKVFGFGGGPFLVGYRSIEKGKVATDIETYPNLIEVIKEWEDLDNVRETIYYFHCPWVSLVGERARDFVVAACLLFENSK